MRGFLLNLQPRWILIQMDIAVLKNILTEKKRGLVMREVKTETGLDDHECLELECSRSRRLVVATTPLDLKRFV
jgi:hypothetical protein